MIRSAQAATSTSGSSTAVAVAPMGLQSLLTPLIKLPWGHCLTHIGRQGRSATRADGTQESIGRSGIRVTRTPREGIANV